MRVRVKICGFTREADVQAAVAAGVDAVGFVRYAKSPRYVSAERAAQLAALLPPFVTPVLLYVNADAAQIQADLALLPHAVLQLHGDETPEAAQALGHAFIKAARIPLQADANFDLLRFCQDFAAAQAVLLDAKVESFGGSGQRFDWSRIPAQLPQHIVLSAGLKADTVAEAVARFAAVGRSLALDVSSGVEDALGIKNADKMQAFVAACRAAQHI